MSHANHGWLAVIMNPEAVSRLSLEGCSGLEMNAMVTSLAHGDTHTSFFLMLDIR